MRKPDWDIVMSHMDESYLQDALSAKRADATKIIIFERENTMNTHKSFYRKLGRSLLVAAVVAVMMVGTVFAANLFGIRDFFNRSDRQLSNAAAADIQQHQVSAEGAGWDCSVTESLCDDSTAVVAVTVISKDEYVLVPTDAQPDDPVADIGLTGDGTLADYAAEQGKKLLMVGAGIDNAGITDASLHYEHISDGELVIMIEAHKTTSAKAIDAVCVVTAVEPDSDEVQRVELPFTLKETATQSARLYSTAESQTISGLEFSEVQVTETSLGLNLEIPVSIADEAAFQNIKSLAFEGLTYSEGGFVLQDDGSWAGTYPMCQGDLGDELTVQVYGWDNELIGEIVLNQQ